MRAIARPAAKAPILSLDETFIAAPVNVAAEPVEEPRVVVAVAVALGAVPVAAPEVELAVWLFWTWI